ncbi:MAG: hypothetical protein IRZ16_16350 [Myxococcaceae bacterium]|nr:hypothetical protein [Myxococcaceae bacterium]
MATHEEAIQVVQRLHALAGGAELRRKAAARMLARLHPTEATELIQHVLELSRNGAEGASCVLEAFVSALGQEAASIPHAASLRRLAMIQDLPAVANLFAEGDPVREMDADVAARNDARLFSDTLGHLKTRARLTRDPDQMARIAAVSNAAVVRELLRNPRLTEPLVVRIAARRPARPEPLLEIWRSPKWFARPAVKRALVFNPYLPPEVGAKIVPLLNTTDLAELAKDGSVHAALREQAKLLLANAVRPGRARAPEGTGEDPARPQ